MMTKNDPNLYDAILSLKNEEEVDKFMTDLCSPAEIKALKERWTIAKILHNTDMGYREISKETGASTTTVGRVARFLKQESYQGYQLVLDRLLSKN